jgi:hypothetical protein
MVKVVRAIDELVVQQVLDLGKDDISSVNLGQNPSTRYAISLLNSIYN